MNVGQQSTSFLVFPDETGGGENLEETLAIGDDTGNNPINHNFSIGVTRNIGLAGMVESVDGGTYLLENDNGTFLKNWFYASKVVFPASILGFGTSEIRAAIDQVNLTLLSVPVLQINPNGNVISVVDGFTLLNNDGNKGIMKYKADPKTNADWDARSVPDRQFVDDAVKFTTAHGATVVNTLNNTWETVTIPGAPFNKVISIEIACTANNNVTGVRDNLSLLQRKCNVDSNSCNFQTVNTNGSGQIEIFSSDISDVTYKLNGSWG